MSRAVLTLTLALALVVLVALAPADRAGAGGTAGDHMALHTDHGTIVIALYTQEVPNTAAYVRRLAASGAFNGTDFFRVEKGFVLQVAPADGARLTAQPLEVRSGLVHRRGVVSLAHPDGEPDGGTGSFSILLGDAPHLDGNYTVFGEVVAGMDVVDAIASVPVDGTRPRTPQLIRQADVTSAAPFVKIETSLGDVLVETYEGAPRHAARFVDLVRANAYTGSQIGRVQAGYYAQLFGGTGVVDAGRLPAELLRPLVHEGGGAARGALVMNDAAGEPGIPSITFLATDSPHLDATHTVVGHVIRGLAVIDALSGVEADRAMRPRQPLGVERMTLVDVAPDSVVLRSARSVGAPDDRGVLVTLGVAQGVLALTIALLGNVLSRSRLRAVALLSVLFAGMMLWVALAPRAPTSGLLSIGVFLGAIGMFRLLRSFERPLPPPEPPLPT